MADWQMTVGPPAFAVGKGVTLTVALAVNVWVQAGVPGYATLTSVYVVLADKLPVFKVADPVEPTAMV